MRSGERGSQGEIEKRQGIGDGHLINDTITEPYGHEIDTRKVERNNQREIVMKRVRVRFICNSPYKDWNYGDTGYIDGYCCGGDGVPCAVIIVNNRVVMAPVNTIRVVNKIKD